MVKTYPGSYAPKLERDLTCQYAHVDDSHYWDDGAVSFFHSKPIESRVQSINGRIVAVGTLERVSPRENGPFYFKATVATIQEYTREDGFTRRRIHRESSGELEQYKHRAVAWLDAKLPND